jgi:hypothetical protein
MFRRCGVLGVALILGSLAGCGATAGREAANTSTETSVKPPPSLRRCPPRRTYSLHTVNPAAADQLVPPDPSSALICRYVESDMTIHGKPSFPPRVATRHLKASRALTDLVDDLDSLAPAEAGENACGELPSPPEYLVALRYRGNAEVYVWAVYNYCASVENGLSPTIYEPSSTLKGSLDRLLRR